MSDHGHHIEGEFHNSWAPITMSMGLMITLLGFAVWGAAFAVVGLTIVFIGLGMWWKQDLPLDGSYEPKAVHAPFHGQDVRKVGMWVFLMSEMMVFSSFFSTYIRYRTRDGFATAGSDATGHVASYYVTHSFWTLLPGGINTLMLIVSSFTVVMALKYAKMPEFVAPKNPLLKMIAPDRRRAIRNNLIITAVLASLFITLKLYEWWVLYHHDHFYHSSGMAGATFYTITGAHGVHVFAGIVALIYMAFKAHRGGYTPLNAQSIEYFGLYWHFVDLMWVIIFPGFYLY